MAGTRAAGQKQNPRRMRQGDVFGLPAHLVRALVALPGTQGALRRQRARGHRGRRQREQEQGGKPPPVIDSGEVAVPPSLPTPKLRFPLSKVICPLGPTLYTLKVIAIASPLREP